MIYELRIYHVYPGKMAAAHERFASYALRLLRKHHMEVVDVWEELSGEKIIYIIKHLDCKTQAENIESFRNDPEWIAAKAKYGPINERTENYLMKRVPYFPVHNSL